MIVLPEEIMEIVISFIVVIIALTLLVKGADLVCNSFIFIARKLKLNEFLVGFIVLGILTSIPETFVALNSIAGEVPQLSVGNLLGASLVLITLVMGLHILFRNGLPFHGKYNSNEAIITIMIVAMPIIVLLDQELSSGEGLLLILAYFVFAFHLRGLFKQQRVAVHNYDFIIEKPKQAVWYLLQAVIGLTLVIVTSRLVVDQSIKISVSLGIDPAVIGIFVLALGTNLPELVILIRSKTNSAERFAVGNFLGSATANTLIIGIIGLTSPFRIANFADIANVIILLGLAALMFIYLEQSNKTGLKKYHGLMFIGIYVALILAEVFIRLGDR